MNIERSTSNVQLSRGSRESRIQKLESTSQELDRWFLSGEDGPQKHVFLRNEPELKAWNCERIIQGANELGRARKLFNSGSFGAEMTDPRLISEATIRMRPRSFGFAQDKLRMALQGADLWVEIQKRRQAGRSPYNSGVGGRRPPLQFRRGHDGAWPSNGADARREPFMLSQILV
jgi:hypothetical protein